MSRSFLRLPLVVRRTGLSRATIHRRIRQGKFPAPVPLGGRTVGWIDCEIDAWIDTQMRLRDAGRTASRIGAASALEGMPASDSRVQRRPSALSSSRSRKVVS